MSTYNFADDNGIRSAVQVLRHYLSGCKHDNAEMEAEIEQAVIGIAEAAVAAAVAAVLDRFGADLLAARAPQDRDGVAGEADRD